jgi:polysaccharide biosynthesis/export protein
MQLASFRAASFNPRVSRSFKATSLTLLHGSTSILTTIAVYQFATTAVQAQTPMPPALPVLQSGLGPAVIPPVVISPAVTPPVVTPPLTAKAMIEAARQRQEAQGKLPVTALPVTVLPVTALPSSALPVTVRGTLVPELGQPLPPQPFNVYRLGAGDSVSVYVQRFADFNFQAVIDPEGKVTHPILGKIFVQGLTVDQAQTRVKQEVDRFIINPIVLLALTNQRPVQVTITGEVTRPGLYPLQAQTAKISGVLLAAGGSRENADLRSVKVRRPLVDGSILEESLDFFTPLKEGRALPDPRLQDGDTIVIAKLPDGERDYDRQVVSRSTLVKPKITVRLLSYARGGLNQVVLDNGSSFLDALASAGLNPDGVDLKKIALVRFDEQQKKAVSLSIDGKQALMGDPTQNIALQDNDVIVIGRNLVGKITYALNVFTQPFRDVLGFLLFFRQLGDNATNLFGPTRR